MRCQACWISLVATVSNAKRLVRLGDSTVGPVRHRAGLGRHHAGLPAQARLTADMPGASVQLVKIVEDFGFSEVEATRCSGASYEFAALRDGQPYRITLRSADGELTDVSRQ